MDDEKKCLFYKNQEFCSYEDFLQIKEKYESKTGYKMATGDSCGNPDYQPCDEEKNKFPYKYKVFVCSSQSGKMNKKKTEEIETKECQFKLRLTLPKKQEGKPQGRMKISILHAVHNHLPDDLPDDEEATSALLEENLTEPVSACNKSNRTIHETSSTVPCPNDKKKATDGHVVIDACINSNGTVEKASSIMSGTNDGNEAKNDYDIPAEFFDEEVSLTSTSMEKEDEIAIEQNLSSEMLAIKLDCKITDSTYDDPLKQSKGATKKVLVPTNTNKNVVIDAAKEVSNKKNFKLNKENEMKKPRGRPTGAVTTAIGLTIKKKNLKYTDLSLKEKMKSILRWLGFRDYDLINLIVNKEVQLQFSMIKSYLASLSDAFMCDDVKLEDFKDFMEPIALRHFKIAVKKMKNLKVYTYTCPICNNDIIGDEESIFCDSCLRWIHTKCAQVKLTKRVKENNYFCMFCTDK